MPSIEEYISTPSPIEKKLFSLFKSDKSLIIFDIGACEGEDSIRYANLFPNAKIFTFEPLATNVAKIQSNLLKFDKSNITVITEALSNKIGEATFFVSSGSPDHIISDNNWDYGNKSSSLLPPDKVLKTHPWLKFKKQITVSTNTLQAFCEQHQITEIDYIHMDVQGAELMVLDGAGAFLSKIKSIWLEVEAISLYKDQPLKKQVEAFMQNHHFVRIVDQVSHISGDQFYVNQHYFPKIKATNFSIYQKVKNYLKTKFSLE